MSETKLPTILSRNKGEILQEWMKELTGSGGHRSGLMKESELRDQCSEFLDLLSRAIQKHNVTDLSTTEFAGLRDFLTRISRTRGEQGFSPTETASFVLLLKRPLFARIRTELQKDPDGMFRELSTVTELLDPLALLTTEAYQAGRERVISSQQTEMMELSTPVVKLWDGVLALPLIGTLDSQRTQTVMESLLQRVLETNSEVVIIDITGVPTVDTLVAQHLLKTVSAARFMGVDCIISGIRPQIAQTIVHLGVQMGDVITKANLADAFKVALSKRGLAVTKAHNGNGMPPAETPAAPPAPANI
jgi:rsbT co-antagonist protein RsbR